jgi:hypothetical protein
MNEPQPSSTAGREPNALFDLAVRVYCWLVMLPVLYVASVGPMYWNLF